MPIRDYPTGKGCRIQVSDGLGRVSTVWRVFSSRKAADFYIVPMMHGGALKISLHASGSWQVGFTKEYQEKVGRPDPRHWEIWRRGSEVGPGMVRGWYVLIPDRELRNRAIDPKAEQLPSPGRDAAVSLVVWIVSNSGPEMIADHARIVGRWPLHGTNESCIVVAHAVPWPHESQRQADECRAYAITEAAAAGVPPDTSHQYFFHGHDPDGVRFGLELGPSDAAEREC